MSLSRFFVGVFFLVPLFGYTQELKLEKRIDYIITTDRANYKGSYKGREGDQLEFQLTHGSTHVIGINEIESIVAPRVFVRVHTEKRTYKGYLIQGKENQLNLSKRNYLREDHRIDLGDIEKIVVYKRPVFIRTFLITSSFFIITGTLSQDVVLPNIYQGTERSIPPGSLITGLVGGVLAGFIIQAIRSEKYDAEDLERFKSDREQWYESYSTSLWNKLAVKGKIYNSRK